MDSLLILFKFFVCGLLTSLIFPPFFIIPLGFVIFPILFFLLIDKKYILLSYKKHFLCGLIYGLGFFCIYLEWINDPFFVDPLTKKYSFFSYSLIFYCALYFGIIFSILKFFKKNIIKFLVLPLLIILSEYICANFIYGFPWFSFSLVHSNNIFGSSIIFYLGTYGLSYLTILFFLFPSIFIIENYNFKKYIYLIFLIILFSVISFTTLRFFTKNDSHDKLIDVSIIQLNFQSNQYLSKDKAHSKFAEIIDIIQNSESELIIFGENDFPFLMDLSSINFIQTYLRNNQNIIIGSTRSDKKQFYNSFFLINKKNYHKFDKKILVPFGEFIPFRSIFSFMKYIAGTIDFTKGNDIRLLKLNNTTGIIPVICYEIIYFWKLINQENLNSNLIINLTNDTWFGAFSGPYQHFYFSKLRAAEYNKSVIRVSNNGVSAFINNKGEIIHFTKLNEKSIITFQLPIIMSENNNLEFHRIVFGFFLLMTFLCFLFNKSYES